MRRTGTILASVGLGLTLCLYGCGGSSKPETEPASEEQAADEAQQEPGEEQADEPVASMELGTAEIPVAGCGYHYELTQVGSLAASRYDVSFQRDGAIVFDGDDAKLLGIDGTQMLNGTAIRGIDYWANGIYQFAADSDDVNNAGLLSLTKGELVPAEAATFSYATDDPADARFVEVIYATEETDNKDECFVYATDKLFSMSVEEGDVMYKGYARVFDLEKGAFVDGVEIHNGARRALHDLGDAFAVEDPAGTFTMYDAKGKELWSTDYYVDFGKSSLCFQSDSQYRIIDATGKVSFATDDGYLNTLSGTDDLYVLKLDDASYVIDQEGNVVLEGTYERVQSEYDGLFVVEEGDKTKIVDGKGTVLVDDVEEYTVNPLIAGLLSYKNAAGERCILKSDGTIIENVDGSTSDINFYRDDQHLVLATGSYDVTLGSSSALDKALVKGHTDSNSSLYALYDLFTGTQVLDGGYELIDWAGGYVYAFNDGTWTIYEAKLVHE